METLQQVYDLNELCNEEEVPEMAWIAVDQSLIGGKLRNFAKKSKISQNEAIGILVRLWLWALDNADQDGKIVAGDMSDVEEAIRAGFLSEEKERVSAITQNLLDCGWIDTKDGELILHDWTDWRSYYTALQEKRAKRAEYMRSYRSGNGKDQEAEKPKEEKPEKKKSKSKRNEYEADFEKFWAAYPRKAEKANAYKKYQARLKDGFSEADLLQAAVNYAKECKAKRTDPQYIKHPKTFLSETTPFVDFLDKKTPAPVTKEQPAEVPNGEENGMPNPFRTSEKGEGEPE